MREDPAVLRVPVDHLADRLAVERREVPGVRVVVLGGDVGHAVILPRRRVPRQTGVPAGDGAGRIGACPHPVRSPDGGEDPRR